MRAPAITEIMRGQGFAEFETRYVNVKDPPFSAKGDGVTDDTIAIQTAINSLTTGGYVCLPPGNFLITSTLLIVSDIIHLVGSGKYVTTIQKHTAGTVLRITLKNEYLLEDFSVQGYTTAGIGLDVFKSNFGTINRVRVDGCSEGLRLTGDYCSRVNDSDFAGNVLGLNVMENVDGLQNNIVNFTGVRFWGNTGWGGIVNGGLGANFIGCTFDSNLGGGLCLGSVAVAGDQLVSLKITHSYFENNTGTQLLVGDSAIITNPIQDTKIQNNYFLIDDTMLSILIDKATNTFLTENTYRHGVGVITHIEVTANANLTFIEESSPSFWETGFVDAGTNTIVFEKGTNEGVWAVRGLNPVCGVKGIGAGGTGAFRIYNAVGTLIGEMRQVWAGGVPELVINAAQPTSEMSFELNSVTRAAFRVNGSHVTFKLWASSMTWAAAAPVDGTWIQGDVCWDLGAIAGGWPGWVCVVAGTPGTWKAMANLAP